MKKNNGNKGFNKEMRREIFLNTIAVLICFVFLFPVYWIIVSSFKSDGEIFRTPQTLFPQKIVIDSYISQFTGSNSIIRPFLNSVIIASSSMILSLILSIPAAYGLARYRIKGVKLILMAFLVSQMLPASLVLTPMFLIFSKIGILNTYIAPIIATATVSIPFIILVLRPIFLNCPKELEEAARIDGCSTIKAFIKVIIPVNKTGIITAASFAFILAWNDLLYSMTFNTDNTLRPMTAGIYHFMNQYGTQWNKIMAYGVLLVLPVIIIFITLQKYIVSGLVNGAVKG